MTTDSTPSPSVVHLPERARLPAFRVAGPLRHFGHANKAEVPQLWGTLFCALPLAGQVQDGRSYGVISNIDGRRGTFDYMAGVAVEADHALPEGFTAQDIAAATYAVFCITLDGSAIHPQVKRAMETIWGELVPGAGLRIADGPDLEVYDERFIPDKAGAQFDFYVPVEA